MPRSCIRSNACPVYSRPLTIPGRLVPGFTFISRSPRPPTGVEAGLSPTGIVGSLGALFPASPAVAAALRPAASASAAVPPRRRTASTASCTAAPPTLPPVPTIGMRETIFAAAAAISAGECSGEGCARWPRLKPNGSTAASCTGTTRKFRHASPSVPTLSTVVSDGTFPDTPRGVPYFLRERSVVGRVRIWRDRHIAGEPGRHVPVRFGKLVRSLLTWTDSGFGARTGCGAWRLIWLRGFRRCNRRDFAVCLGELVRCLFLRGRRGLRSRFGGGAR
jgi:hypothetical protein